MKQPTIRQVVFVLALTALSTSAFAQRKPCEELKAEIKAKIDSHGVKKYTLEIVPVEEVKNHPGKVVGHSDGGTKRIIYNRG